MLDVLTYSAYKATERFLDSFVLAKPIPHFVAAKHAASQKNPFGLERIQSFLKALEHPQRCLQYVHIAGTSGKTSTTWLTAAVLRSQGYKTGMVTSPHLMTFLEYFTINGHVPPVHDILSLIEEIKPLIDQEYQTSGCGMISYAELVLALAFLYFARQQVDYVALEAFLGGRTDATNVIEQAEVSILTNIGLDHTHILGHTLPEIAREKLGILKPGCPLITAEQRSELLDLFVSEAHTHETTMQRLGQEFRIAQIRPERSTTVFDYISDRHIYRDLQISAGGAYQAANAALAIRALEIVAKNNDRPIIEEALRDSLASTNIPGRFEQVADDPVVILDAAHNPDKIAQLVEHLKHQFRRGEVLFVCAFTSGKNAEDLLRPMLEVSQTFYLTRAIIGYRDDEEPLYLKSVLNMLDPSIQTNIALDPLTALDQAMAVAQNTGQVVCVTGSAYLVGYVRQRWFPEYTLLGE